tara:strand:- start:433 stop:1041 length:609 start_codon:yes stop_codon:yes gene_type:complete
MFDLVLKLDSYLFQFINSYLSNPILDVIFVFFHKPHNHLWFIVFILFLTSFYIYKERRKAVFVIIFLIIGITITDQIGRGIKYLELRYRPYVKEKIVNVPEAIYLPKIDTNYKKTESSKKSFPSNHAANIVLLSSLLSYIYNSKKKYFITFAILVGISRIYVGVHYPLDVIAGAILGITISYLMIKLLEKLEINLAKYHQEA